MIRRTLIFSIFLFIAVASFSQNDSLFRFVRDYRGVITDFSVDNLGNVYLIFQNGQLKKLRPNGDSLAVFNNVRKFGKLHSIDVSNPLKVLLYYRDFGTIVILDRFLNERSTIDLRRNNLLQVKAIGQSYDNNIWIFDELEVKLKKIGDDGRLIDQSNDFRLIFDSTPSPSHIIDQDKYVYLYDPAKGVYTFDYYGAFRNRIPFTGWSDFLVINNSLFGRDKKFLYRYDAGSFNLQQYQVPTFMNEAQKIIIAPGNVYLLKDGTIKVYSYF
jgi:hypothetical protein